MTLQTVLPGDSDARPRASHLLTASTKALLQPFVCIHVAVTMVHLASLRRIFSALSRLGGVTNNSTHHVRNAYRLLAFSLAFLPCRQHCSIAEGSNTAKIPGPYGGPYLHRGVGAGIFGIPCKSGGVLREFCLTKHSRPTNVLGTYRWESRSTTKSCATKLRGVYRRNFCPTTHYRATKLWGARRWESRPTKQAYAAKL